LQGPGEKLTVQESETNTIFTKEISEKKIAYTLNIIPAAKGSSVLISYSLFE
jgi:V8-like Glu-specific endopeptidase